MSAGLDGARNATPDAGHSEASWRFAAALAGSTAQPALPFEWPATRVVEHFIVAPSNAAAVRHLELPKSWSAPASLLVGPRQSGRSLLARVFAWTSGGRIVDDADRADERRLFTAWNDAQASGVPLLLVAERAPPAWPIALADLASRLRATPVATIEAPDDALVGQLVAHLLARRGVVIAPEAVAYLVARGPRTHHGVVAMVDTLDAASLAARRPVTIPLARQVLGQLLEPGLGR